MPISIAERNKLYAAKRALQLLLLYEAKLIRIPLKYKPDKYLLTPSNLDGWVSVVKEYNSAYFNALDWAATSAGFISALAGSHLVAASARISGISVSALQAFLGQLREVSTDIKANHNLKDFIRLADALSKIAASTSIASVPA